MHHMFPKTILLLVLFATATASFAQDLAYIEVFGSKIYFEPPDTSKWEMSDNSAQSETMHLLQFIHAPIADSEGHEIRPVIAIIAEKVTDSVDVVTYSIAKRLKVSFKVVKVLTPQDSCFDFQNAIGYEGTYDSHGVLHRVIIAHMRHAEVGLQVICDSTDGVYSSVVHEMRRFIKSIGIDM